MSFVSERERMGLTQQEAAERLGVDPLTFRHWETGRNTPRASMLVKLSALYCCSIDDLLGRERGDSA